MKTIFCIGVVLITFGVFGSAKAATIQMDSDNTVVQVGDTVTIMMTISNDSSVNAIEGQIEYPIDQLRLVQARDTGSVVTLWVKRPLARDPGTVTFMGITPGGFLGTALPLVQLEFVVLAPGSIPVKATALRALRHDGLGTDEPVIGTSLTLVSQADQVPQTPQALLTPAIDSEPPLPFTPVLVADLEAFDGKATLIFETSDQGSGIDQYLVKEYRHPWLAFFAPWQVVHSFYTLTYQDQSSYVLVKALDYSGNEQVSVWYPMNPVTHWWLWWIVGAKLVLITLGCMYRKKLIQYVKRAYDN
jgi:hypothetical protein